MHSRQPPGYYQITFTGLNSDLRLTGLDIDRGDGWIPAQPVESITPTVFSQLYAPIAVNTVPEPVIWSGEITIEGHQILDQPLIIEPGTTVNLAPKATVVLKHRLTAIGHPRGADPIFERNDRSGPLGCYRPVRSWCRWFDFDSL